MRNELGFAFAVFLGRAEGTGFRAKDRGAGAVNGLAVHFHPRADFLEAVHFRLRNQALAGRADVKQIISAFAGDVAQVVDERRGGFEVLSSLL
jgi:hypothetical protein